MKNRCPEESTEQTLLFQWAEYQSGKYPELSLMYHIPNGGSRNKAEAGRLKAQGVKPGLPDICLPVARGKYHGLYIELKRVTGGRTSKDQREWIKLLLDQGYLAGVCLGWEEAADTLMRYLCRKGERDG